jgi:hypothetical protein
MPQLYDEPEYSEHYTDGTWLYRHVLLSEAMYKKLVMTYGKGRLLTESEWRDLGLM